MCEDKDKTKRPVRFDAVLEDVGAWNILDIVGAEEWRPPFVDCVEADTQEQSDENGKLLDELKDALFGDMGEEKRWDLWHRVDAAFGKSLYRGNKPQLLLGVALGMFMCGVGIEEVKQRMKWLL